MVDDHPWSQPNGPDSQEAVVGIPKISAQDANVMTFGRKNRIGRNPEVRIAAPDAR
jgi:hypothetical protein